MFEHEKNVGPLPLRGRLLALAFGMVVAAAILITTDWIFGALDARWRAARTYTGGDSVPDDLLGYRWEPNLESHASLTGGGELLWSVVYRTNRYGWREVPQSNQYSPQHPASKFLIFFGGSFVFGNSVEDWETLPSRTAENLPDWDVYNYGGIGYGPQQALALVESGEVTAQVRESGGSAVYVLYFDHVSRAVGAMNAVTGWANHFPFYELDESGKAVRRGNFDTARPRLHRLYQFIHSSGIVRYTWLDIPTVYTEDHYALVAEMLCQTRDGLAANFRLDHFFVLLYPAKKTGRTLVDRCCRVFRDAGLEVLDYRDLFDPEDPENCIHPLYDKHPSPRAHAVVANQLAAVLESAGE